MAGQANFDTKLVGVIGLPSGERLVVVYREYVPEEVTLGDLTENRQRFSHLSDKSEAKARFGILGTNPHDDSLFIVEGAVHPHRA